MILGKGTMKRIICIMLSLLLVLGGTEGAVIFAGEVMEQGTEEGREAGTETEAVPGTEKEPETEAVPGTEKEPETEAVSGTEKEPETEAVSGTEKEPETAPGTEEEPETESGTEKETETGTEKDPSTDPGEVTKPEKTIQVLIVGNSFSRYTTSGITYTVEKPLEELAAGEGKSLEVTTLAHGSARLRYYAGMNDAYMSYHKELITLLVNGEWDYIIFQEHSTAPMVYFESSTYPAVEKLLQFVSLYQPKAKPLLYMTPGYSNGSQIKIDGESRVLTTPEFQLYLAAAYKTLENKLGVEVVPVGMHAMRTNLLYPQIQMTGPDSKHPTYAGYYLAACSFYQRIYGAVPNPSKANLSSCNLGEGDLKLLAGLTADSMTISPKNITLTVGKTAKVSAVYDSHITKSSAIVYKSFDTNVATVDPQSGVITAKGGGNTAIVAATSDGLQAFCNIVVKIPISFARSYYLAGIGDEIQILPTTNAKNFKWSSSKTSVASVDSDGRATVKASGRTVITVTNQDDSSDKDSYELYVTCETPTGLEAASSGDPAENASVGNIKISWKSVLGADGYDVYRSTSAGGTYQLIGSATKSSYTDKTAAVNKTYYYKVTAKNGYAYCTSPLSARTRGVILKAPTLKVSRVSKKYAKLTWKKNSKATGYAIYRSTKKNSGYKKIATVTKTKKTYTDKTVKKKKTYYYRIKAYKKLDGQVFYGVKSLKVKIKI